MADTKNLPWYLYMVRTRQGQLYTGITQDVKRRFLEHQEGGKKSAKFLRGKAPLKLEFQQEVGTRSWALKIESAIKKLPKQKKENLATKGDKISLVSMEFSTQL